MKRIKRVFTVAFLLAVIFGGLMLHASAAEIVASGYCGEGGDNNLSWTLTRDGVLTISGTGKMNDYSSSNDHRPWGEAVREIIIDDGVTSIGDYAFFRSSWFYLDICVTSVTIPDSVTSIGKGAFQGCCRLGSVTLPAGVTSIGENAFLHCDYLKEIIVDADNDFYCDVEGVLFNKDKTALIKHPSKKGGDYAVPDGVTYIEPLAFYECESLTSVTIPDSVTTIGYSAFWGCKGLTTATIGNGVTVIESSAFRGCGLTSVTIGNSVSSIGREAFQYCGSLTSVIISASVTYIGYSAFDGCTSLTAVYFEGKAVELQWLDDYYYHTFEPCVTLYYIPGTFGWTDVDSFAPGTWFGYRLVTWSDYQITPVSEDIIINGKGYGVAYFRLTGPEGKPLAKTQVDVDGKTTVLTDDNGVFSIRTPWADYAEKYGTARRGPVELSTSVMLSLLSETGQELHSERKTIRYRLTPAIFTQEWEGYVAVGGSIGLGLGAGAAIGAASAEINIIGAEAGLSAGSGLKVTYDHTDTGHDLTLTHTDVLDGNYGFKSGIQATVLTVNMALHDASAGSTLTSLRSTGLKIPNYNPLNLNQQEQVGHFLLQCYLMGSRSVVDQQLLNRLLNTGHNMSAAGQKVLLEAGATAGRLEILQGSEVGLGQEKVSAEAALVMEYEKAENHLTNSVTYTTGVKTDYGAGLDKGGWLNGSNTVSTSGTADYRRGIAKTNSISVSTWSQGFADLFGASYTFYKEGELDFGSLERTDVATQITFEKEAAEAVVAANEDFRQLHAGKKSAFSAKELLAVGDYILESDQPAGVAEISNRKKGISLELPVSIKALGAVSLSVNGEFTATTSHEKARGVKLEDQIYMTGESALTDSDIKAQEISLLSILDDPVEATVHSLLQSLSAVAGKVVDGVANGYAAVTDALSDFWVEIQTNPGILAQSESYVILAVAEEDLPVSDAAVAVTLGEPYLVTVYKDETKENPVSGEELAASPVTLTLSYTADMLSSAGITPDANLYIYWFDSTRNLYVCQTDSVQDKTAMTVAVPLKNHGEYILATDNASPLVSDFAVSNGTPTPRITALVSDLSGIESFRFWLDEGEELVDEDDLDAYYDPATGIFTYTVTAPLSAGEHKACFYACDALGNENAEPFVFTFTVDAEAPVITAVNVPTKTVTDADGFTVTAAVAETEDLAGVALVVNGGQSVAFPMQKDENGLWTVQVTGIAGLTSLDVCVTATDYAGNQARSEKQTVSIAIPGTTVNVVLTPGEWKDNAVTVTVENCDIGAASGWLVCAAYDENGKMLGIGSRYVGLTGKDTREYELTLNCKTDQAAEVKAFLLSGTTQFGLDR